MWNRITDERITLEDAEGTKCAAFSPDGKYLVMATNERSIEKQEGHVGH